MWVETEHGALIGIHGRKVHIYNNGVRCMLMADGDVLYLGDKGDDPVDCEQVLVFITEAIANGKRLVQWSEIGEWLSDVG